MPNFNLDDIIELAKQGYKPADIKELIELSKSNGEKPKDDQKEQPKDDQKEQPKDDQKEQPKDDHKEQPKDDAVDYKGKVTQLEEELQKTKELLQKLQTENTKKDASGGNEKTDAEAFAEAMKSFM